MKNAREILENPALFRGPPKGRKACPEQGRLVAPTTHRRAHLVVKIASTTKYDKFVNKFVDPPPILRLFV